MRSERSINAAISKALRNPQASFVELVKLCGLDPKRAFRFADLGYVDLSYEDLSGYDFTGADLSRADLFGANLHGTILVDAILPNVSALGKSATGMMSCEDAGDIFSRHIRNIIHDSRTPRDRDYYAAIQTAPSLKVAAQILHLMIENDVVITQSPLTSILKRIPKAQRHRTYLRIGLYRLICDEKGDDSDFMDYLNKSGRRRYFSENIVLGHLRNRDDVDRHINIDDYMVDRPSDDEDPFVGSKENMFASIVIDIAMSQGGEMVFSDRTIRRISEYRSHGGTSLKVAMSNFGAIAYIAKDEEIVPFRVPSFYDRQGGS